MTISPIASDEISLSPWLSSSRTIFETICSIRSGSTGRLRNAICTERISLSRSKGTRRPLRLITVNSRSCTRSKVVKRKLHVRQTRRRRMTAESSVGRESFTCVSRLPQLGQRMSSLSLSFRNARKADEPGIQMPRLVSEFRARRGAPSRNDSGKTATASLILINRKSFNQCLHFGAHRSLDEGIFLDMFLRQDVEDFDNHVAYLAEFCDAESSGRARGRAEPNA